MPTLPELANISSYQLTDGNTSELITGYQGAPATPSVTATLTAAQLATQLLVADQAASGAATYTLPTGTLMDAAFPNMRVNASFDFAVCNIGSEAAEDVTIATGTGWTLVGNMVVASNAAATDQSAAMFRARRTADATWILYRIS
jgi:hypothetical protein